MFQVCFEFAFRCDLFVTRGWINLIDVGTNSFAAKEWANGMGEWDEVDLI